MQQLHRNIDFGIRYTFFVVSLFIFSTSCSTLKHLKEDETLLRKNQIEFSDSKAVKELRYLKYELSTLIYQKPNTKFLWIPRQWFYYKVDEPKDTSKFDNFIRKNWSEDPAIYDANQTEATARKMEQYMRERGFFNVAVEYEVTKKNQKTNVFYTVHPEKRYYLDTVHFKSLDKNIHQILEDLKTETFLKNGAPVDEKIYYQEVDRVTKYLKNNGYANFYSSYVGKLQGDSTDNKVNVNFEVLLKNDSTQHKTYTVGKVIVKPSFNPKIRQDLKYDSIVNGIHFLTEDNIHFIKPKAIAKEIFIKTGDLYRLENIEKTKRQLGQLDIFQFIDVRRIPDANVDTVLNYEIRLIPKKRQQIGGDFEFNNSRLSTSNSVFLGTAASLSYRNRNIFHGAEVFSFRAEGGVEIDVRRSNGELLNSWDVNLVADVDFPKFFDFPGTAKFLHWINVMGDNTYDLLREQATSRASIGYNILKLVNNYRIDIFTASLKYRLQNTPRRRHNFTQIGVNFLNPKFEIGFDTILANNLFLRNSLSEQLFTGFLVRDYTFTYQTTPNRIGASFFFQGNAESSGHEIAAINGLWNGLANRQDTFAFNKNYEFSQYIKLELDGRYYRKLGAKSSLATRVNFGVAMPYGFSDAVPYVQQFFVGGPTSLRGWRIRELGPGGFNDPAQQLSNTFYQAGDFKLEMNAEYRFELFWRLRGAMFLDMGNIWTLREDQQRIGAGLNNFAKEIAIGTGFGMRLDLTFFLLRLDLGYKLRNPFPNEMGNYWTTRSLRDLKLSKVNWNLAVGYPF